MSGRSLSEVLEKGDKLLRPWNASKLGPAAPVVTMSRQVSPLRRRVPDPPSEKVVSSKQEDVFLNNYKVPVNETLPPLCNIIERSNDGSVAQTATKKKTKSNIEHMIRKVPSGPDPVSVEEVQRIAEQQLAECEREFGILGVSDEAHVRRTSALQALVQQAGSPQDGQQSFSTQNILKLRSELYTIMKREVTDAEIDKMKETIRTVIQDVDSSHEASGELILSVSSELMKILGKNASLTNKCSATGREIIETANSGPDPQALSKVSDAIASRICNPGELEDLLLGASSSVGSVLSQQVAQFRSQLLSLQDQVVSLQRQSRDQISQIHNLQDTTRALSSQHTRTSAENRELRQLLNSILTAASSKAQPVCLQSPARLM